MARGIRWQVPADVAAVRQRVEHWRRARTGKRGPMPKPLWDEVVAMAARHGLWRVARALRVNYASLKARASASDRRGSRTERDAGVAFVELKAAGSGEWTDPSAGAVVELSGADGTRLVIRARSGEGVDVLGLAEAFWRRRA